MTRKEINLLRWLRKELTGIYAVWHACGLRKNERGLKKDRLCDVCLNHIAQHMLRAEEAMER